MLFFIQMVKLLQKVINFFNKKNYNTYFSSKYIIRNYKINRNYLELKKYINYY